MRWIKHDTDANQDARLQNVLLDYGLEGYGLYWYCIELIAGRVDVDNITFELEHDARIIARNVGSTVQKVEEMMRYFVDQGLFENNQGAVTCFKLAKRLDKSMTSNPKMRELIDEVRNSHDCIMSPPDKVMQDKIRLDKTREDINTSSIDDAFDIFWSSGMKKVNKKKALTAFKNQFKQAKSKLRTDSKEIEFAQYLANDIQFRLTRAQLGFDAMHPTTYLNGQRWNDEKPSIQVESPGSEYRGPDQPVHIAQAGRELTEEDKEAGRENMKNIKDLMK